MTHLYLIRHAQADGRKPEIRGIALKNGSKFGDRGSSWVSISGARSPGSGGVLEQLYGMDGEGSGKFVEGREGLSMSQSLLVHLLGIGH